MTEATIHPENGNETEPEPPPPVVLELRSVSLRGSRERDMSVKNASMKVRAGEQALIGLKPRTQARGVASMIQGLIRPSSGRILFQSQDWLGSDYERHFRMRSRIGRVFENRAWIENLNVMENVTLARRHHGDPESGIERQIQYWLKRFEQEELSRSRPSFIDPTVLQWHQWIRAFLGRPDLLILERPMGSLSSEWKQRLTRALDELRDGGTAVVWFMDSRDMESIPDDDRCRRFQLDDDRLHDMEDGGNR